MAKPKDNYYVGIGASAGGLEALEAFFKVMPTDTGLTFIVVQHLSPDFKSMMDELLARYTKMEILIAEDGMKTEPNKIYLIKPRTNLSIFKGKLYLQDQASRSHLNLPIDIFFRSLAEDKEKLAIGVILSGTGSDGTLGVRAIKESGGMVMVQDEQTAKFDGMPRSSIATGIVDYILPPHRMAEELLNYIKHPDLSTMEKRFANKRSSEAPEGETDELAKISMIMRKHSGIDFASYKENTMIRRIDRRVKINRLNNIDEYIGFLAKSQEERNILQRELLIGVTSFFRDPDAFASLEEKVLPEIDFEKKEIRAWSAGCSTGEEVYSLAILLHEYQKKIGSENDIKIFGTDVDVRALEIAGNGYYPESIISDIAPELVAKYFIKREEGYQVAESIRKMVVFAKHNILKDPPFSKLDLLSCRNLFIYLKNEYQQRVLTSFYYSLNPEGFLILGSSESIGDLSTAFKAVDIKWKIYQYKKGFKAPLNTTTLFRQNRAENKALDEQELVTSVNSMQLDRVISAAISSVLPPSIIIDSNDNLVQIINDVSPFIASQPGRFSNNFNSNMKREQALFVNNIIRRLKKSRQEMILSNISCFKSVKNTVSLQGKVFSIEDRDYFLISFIENKEADQKDEQVVLDVSEEVEHRVRTLESELQLAREGLQATIEELETSNEELQSSNEELIASNEELQSTNEELQSVNEELFTVNNEHQSKIDQLVKLNNDLNNLIKNTGIGALYLDSRLCIRKITSVVSEITNILETDIGRPINHLSSLESYPNMVQDINYVLDSLQNLEKEIVDKNGDSYLVRIRPYRTENNAVDGIILTFVDINNLKKEQADVSRQRKRLEYGMEIGKMAWWEFDMSTNHLEYSPQKMTLLGFDPQELTNDFQEILIQVHPQDRATVRESFANCINGQADSLDLEFRMRRKDGSYGWFHNSGKTITSDQDNTPQKMMGTIIDISNLKQLEEELQQRF